MYNEFDSFGYNEWSESDTGDIHTIVKSFLRGPMWENVCSHADGGCLDSLEFMENIHMRVTSILYFMENDIYNRLDRESKELTTIINEFN